MWIKYASEAGDYGDVVWVNLNSIDRILLTDRDGEPFYTLQEGFDGRLRTGNSELRIGKRSHRVAWDRVRKFLGQFDSQIEQWIEVERVWKENAVHKWRVKNRHRTGELLCGLKGQRGAFQWSGVTCLDCLALKGAVAV